MDGAYKVGVVIPTHPLPPAATRKICGALTPCGNVSAMTNTEPAPEAKSISGNVCGKCGLYKNARYQGYTAEEVAPYLCTC